MNQPTSWTNRNDAIKLGVFSFAFKRCVFKNENKNISSKATAAVIIMVRDYSTHEMKCIDCGGRRTRCARVVTAECWMAFWCQMMQRKMRCAPSIRLKRPLPMHVFGNSIAFYSSCCTDRTWNMVYRALGPAHVQIQINIKNWKIEMCCFYVMQICFNCIFVFGPCAWHERHDEWTRIIWGACSCRLIVIVKITDARKMLIELIFDGLRRTLPWDAGRSAHMALDAGASVFDN